MNQAPHDLFQAEAAERRQQQSPLANRMRPLTLDDYAGQEHIIGPGRLLRRSIEADQLSSLILYGPPGTGKTTLASVIANTSSSAFVTLNAVLAGVKVLREEIEAAGRSLHIDSSGPLCLWTRSLDGTPDRVPSRPAWKTVLPSLPAPPTRTLALRSSSPSSATIGLVPFRQFREHEGGRHPDPFGNVPKSDDPTSPVTIAPDWKGRALKHRSHAVAFEE